MDKKILVETSARHIHLSQEAFDYLMDQKDAVLNVRAPLSQPGQFVSDVRLNLVGPVNPKTGKPRAINGVSILGPVRNLNQVEISLTDARTLGVKAPIRLSGHVEGSAPVKVVNPVNGRELDLTEGVIVAKRHIHMTPEDAAEFGVVDGDIVCVKVENEDRTTVFGDTVIRVSPKFALAMHIDTDEANAAACSGEVYGTIKCIKGKTCECGK